MRSGNLEALRNPRAMVRFGMIVLVALAAATMVQGAGPSSPTPSELYARMKKETLSHNAYTATYYQASERGKSHEMFARGRLSGKYLQKPLLLCEKRLTMESSFPEQAGPGEQECYSGKDDVNRILMPGAYRALGVIVMFPEDPKASYINGENMKRTAVWTWFPLWDRMMEGGQLLARQENRKGKPHWVLTIIRGKNPDPLYNHNKMQIWIDPERWFPVRTETFVPNDPKPVMVYDFEQLQLDPPLTEKDVTFEGPAPSWSLVSASGGAQLGKLQPEEPKVQDSPGLDPASFMAQLDQALAAVRDYSTDLTLELRYFRLRQYRQDSFNYLRAGGGFSALTTRLEANYIQVNSGDGFRTVFDPGKNKLLHVIPAGVYKVMGEQTFPLDDPRIFTALGDNITSLNFFAIRDELKRRLTSAVRSKAGLAAYKNAAGPWLEIVSENLNIPATPTVIRLLLDGKSHLPLRLEYRGYDDPKGNLVIRFANTKINRGIKGEELWK